MQTTVFTCEEASSSSIKLSSICPLISALDWNAIGFVRASAKSAKTERQTHVEFQGKRAETSGCRLQEC